MPSYFITGTGTDVGKTWFTCWLLRAWRARGFSAAALKPVATGGRDDARLIAEASGHALSLDEINPLHFRVAAAPLVAARAENRPIDFQSLNQSVHSTRARFSHFAVEGVGGWRVPLAPGYEVREWARDLGLPVIVVALNRLGMLNHTLLTLESIASAGLTCAGVIVNPGPADDSVPSPDLDFVRLNNLALLREQLLLPVLELERGVQTAGHVPAWLGGEEA